MSGFTDDMTLGDARDLLRTKVDEGERCPCCTQLAKVYKRTIHSTMARELIALYRKAGTETVFLTDVLPRGGDLVKCRYWNLIAEVPGVRADGSPRAGLWRLTALGEDFVFERTSIPKYAHIYDGRCLRLSGQPRTVSDCLGKRFNYAELMRGA